MPPKLIFDDEQLRTIVAASTSWWQVARALRPDKPRGIYKSAQRRVKELQLDTSHFNGRKPHGRTRWSIEELENAVRSSASLAQVIIKLGLIPAGGNYNHVREKIEDAKLDTSHFTGQAWNVGGTFIPVPARPLEQLLVVGCRIRSYALKQRLFREGLKKPQCELCGWAQQAPDGRIPVELDHKNGDPYDNRLENLRVLCPNCHSLQPTHRGLNRKSRRAIHASEMAAQPSGAYVLRIAAELASSVVRTDFVSPRNRSRPGFGQSAWCGTRTRKPD